MRVGVRRPYPAQTREDARQRKYPLREVFNVLRYIMKASGQQRWMPHDLPPWPVVYRVPSGQGQLSLVVLDLASGRELGQSRVDGTEPSIGQLFIGTQDDVYFPTTDVDRAHGYLNRVFITSLRR